MKNKPPLDRLIELQKFLLAFRDIKRVVHIAGKTDEQENDIEHSYVLAMAAWYLSQYFPDINTERAMQLGLVHDLVEVYAGDTFFYAHESILATQNKRELQAYKQILKEWPDFGELTDAIKEYESLETAESRFVYALDKIMPIIMIYLAEGYTWKKEKITLSLLHERKVDKVALSPEVLPYYEKLIELLEQNSHFFHQTGLS
jgi:putative hydrolases of HD superfamily